MSSEKREFVVLWKIENFSFRSEKFFNGGHICSPKFVAKCLWENEWKILFYPRSDTCESLVSCRLQCLYRQQNSRDVLKLTDISFDKSVEEDAVGYCFDLLDTNGVTLCSSGIKVGHLNFRNDSDLYPVRGLVEAMNDWPEDTVMIRCVLMKIFKPSFHKYFNNFLETQRADEAKYDCECQTIWGIDCFTFVRENLSCIKENFVIPMSIPLDINITTTDSEQISLEIATNHGHPFKPIFMTYEMALIFQDDTAVKAVKDKRVLQPGFKSDKCGITISTKKGFLISECYLKFKIMTSNLTRVNSIKNNDSKNEINNLPGCFSNRVEVSTQTSEIPTNVLEAPTSSRISNSTQTEENNANFKLQELVKEVGSPLQEDLNSILLNEKFADVTLKLDKVLIPAHKALLAARSPVFSTMFDQDMIESRSGSIDIRDVDLLTLMLFLKYLYTDTAEIKSQENAIKLMTIADKYQVMTLKEKCSTYLKTILCDANVCDVVAIADMLNQEDLKVCATDYIKRNASKVLSAPQWGQWLRRNLELAAEIMAKVSSELGDAASKSSSI